MTIPPILEGHLYKRETKWVQVKILVGPHEGTLSDRVPLTCVLGEQFDGYDLNHELHAVKTIKLHFCFLESIQC